MGWSSQNKILPGVYTNFSVSRPAALEIGQRGTVAIPGEFDWGKAGTVLAVDDTNVLALLGHKLINPEMMPLRLALMNAKRVLTYRVGEGQAARGTINTGLEAVAVCGGTRGNALAVMVKAAEGLFVISTLLAGEVMDIQTVAVASEFRPNGWISLEGEGTLAAKTVTLTGGENGSPAAADYDAAFAAFELEDFEVITYCGTEPAIKAKLIAYTKAQRQADKLIQCVVVDDQADSEAVISLRQGFIWEDGSDIPMQVAAAWLAGASAGASITQSNTYTVVDGVIGVKDRYTRYAAEQAVLQGQCVFELQNGKVVLLYDINTLLSGALRKNKVMRVIDTTNKDIVRIIKTEYLGKVPNNEDGRSRVKGRIVEYLSAVQAMGAIENFSATDDVSVEAGADSDAILVHYAIQPVDTGDKFYLTAEVI